MSFHSTL
jgi:hypothetical protein